MNNPSLTKTLPALLTLTGGALLATAATSEAASSATRPEPKQNTLEARIKNVQEKLKDQPELTFEQKTSADGLQTFWWGNWHNGGWGPGMWHNWGNGGWHNWGNGWGNGGWHNWHNWGNW